MNLISMVALVVVLLLVVAVALSVSSRVRRNDTPGPLGPEAEPFLAESAEEIAMESALEAPGLGATDPPPGAGPVVTGEPDLVDTSDADLVRARRAG